MGPLQGIKIIEIAGIGPGPFCAMMLADMGAEVVRVERPAPEKNVFVDGVLSRGRCSIQVDLKTPEGRETVLRLVRQADALIEGFRPGVMERVGLGPETCLEYNGRLVYGRITGWGQEGSLATTAGHDINYLALSGALHAIGRAGGKPVAPLNLVADFGGGGMLLAFGIACAIINALRSGVGQVVDASMVDGAALQMAMIYDLKAAGAWSNRRGENFFDGGLACYDTYECADGKFLAIGCLEPQFFEQLLERCGLDHVNLYGSEDPSRNQQLRGLLTDLFKTKTRDEWCELTKGSDACLSPVLDLDEAPLHPHNVSRGTFVVVDGVAKPAPAPRFSRTPTEINSTVSLPDWVNDALGPSRDR